MSCDRIGSKGEQAMNKHFWIDPRREALAVRTEGMYQPVECCHCGGVYDLGTVTVTARYADCSVWKAPCCGCEVDSRGEVDEQGRTTGWKSIRDYRWRCDPDAHPWDGTDPYALLKPVDRAELVRFLDKMAAIRRGQDTSGPLS
jgi:hypothetical protein